MKLLKLFLLFIFISAASFAQSKTTEALNKRFSDATVFFFYKNTLKMLNQTDDKNFDELIKDIEKMKLLRIDKSKNFGTGDYKKIIADYKSEAFEEVMTSRHEGKSFDIYMKDKGMLVLVNDSSSLFVLDIVGKISLDKITKLYSTIDANTEIGSRIKEFANGHK